MRRMILLVVAICNAIAFAPSNEAWSQAADYGGATCEDALARQNAAFDAGPPPTDLMLRYRYLLAYFEGRIDILNNNCRGNAGAAEGRAQLVAQRDAALAQCRGVGASPQHCVAAMPNNPPTMAVAAPPRAPAARPATTPPPQAAARPAAPQARSGSGYCANGQWCGSTQ